MLSLVLLLTYLQCGISTSTDPMVVEVITGPGEDSCGVYPVCRAEGSWAVVEDCTRFYTCIPQPGSRGWVQTNLQCPRPLVYSPAHTQCVEPALAPAECAAWQQLKCAAECPRVLLTSTGPALQLQPQALGCFRLRGSRDLNRAAYYENTEGMTLTPYPALIWIREAFKKCGYFQI